MPYFNHNSVSEHCSEADESTVQNGMVCDNNVQVRRIAFHDYKPSNSFRGSELRIVPFEFDLEEGMTEEER